MKFLFQSSPEVTIATHKFINVPVVLQYEDTPLMEIIRHQDIGFTTQIPIYHSDGMYLAKVTGNRVYPTEAGLKANIEIRNPQGKVICSLDNKVMFELSHGIGDTFKAEVELYTPDGCFVRCTDAPKPELYDLSDLSGNAIQVFGLPKSGHTIENFAVGIWLRKDGSCAIGVNR